ncbi:transposable element Tcb1 transposase [Trichonephila clavipes]|nr:transposable element Tcb1 transposase [Trichonephila clavipes]
MQEGTMGRRGRSYPPQCTTSREDRQIVRMAVTDRSVTSQTVAHHIESVTHHSVSARTIRLRLKQSGLSARRPLLVLPLTQNHRRLSHQWYDERRIWVTEWNKVVFTDESRICLQHHDGRIRVWRQDAEQLRYAPPHWSCTGAWPQPYFNRIMRDHTWHALSKGSSSITRLNCFPHRLTQITTPAASPDQLWQRVEAAWSDVLHEHIQSLFESMPRNVAVVILNNEGYSGY